MFIVIKRQSMLGDGLGHIAFAGVTGASLLKVYPPLGAVILTVLSAMGIELVRRYTKTIRRYDNGIILLCRLSSGYRIFYNGKNA